MTLLKIKIGSLLLLFLTPVFAQENVYKEVTLEKYKLQSRIKTLLTKSSEAQKNILFLEEEIQEMKRSIENNRNEQDRIQQSIRANFTSFSSEIIKYKLNDSDDKNILKLQTFKNWNSEFARLKGLTTDLENTKASLVTSNRELRESIVAANSIMLSIKNEIEELDTIQNYLRSDLEVSGPDSDFFKLVGRLKWPLQKATLVGSKGFYKIPGERVYDYNEGLKFSAERGEPVYPIAKGILEGEIFVPNLGQILIVKHTENIRSFYIGAATIPGVLINDPLSPDQQLGLVKSPVLELKLRFDTESLDPSEWVKFRR